MNKFSDRSLSIPYLAQNEARRLQHHLVGTVHLLLAILTQDEGIAIKVLTARSVDLTQLRTELEQLHEDELPGVLRNLPYSPFSFLQGSSPEAADLQGPWNKNLPYSAAAETAFKMADEESEALEQGYLGSEHILLGILLQNGSSAQRLNNFGLTFGIAKAEIVNELNRKAMIPPPAIPSSATRFPEISTRRIKEVLEFARKEADGLVHAEVTTGHLLLGVMLMGIKTGPKILKRLGGEVGAARNLIREIGLASPRNRELGELAAKMDQVRIAIDLAIKAQEFEKAAELRPQRIELNKRLEKAGKRPWDMLPYAIDVKTTFAGAAEEAKAMRYPCIELRHLWLSLMRQKESQAVHVLVTLGIDLDKTRIAILNTFDNG